MKDKIERMRETWTRFPPVSVRSIECNVRVCLSVLPCEMVPVFERHNRVFIRFSSDFIVRL